MTQAIQVPLASNVVYVSGTVNGVSTTWTREDGNIWGTVADKAEDNTYRVVLSMLTTAGQSYTDSVTLYYGLVLITDRTLADVQNKTDKGYYNATDLNRVGSAMQYLAARFADNGYTIDVSPETAWTMEDIPTQSDMTAYLSYLGTLRGMLALPAGTPETPSTMDFLTYVTANNIEKILEIVDQMLTNSLLAAFYSGEVYSGEVDA